MAKSVVKVMKSYREGHIQLQVKAGVYQVGASVASTVSVDLGFEAASKLHAELGLSIQKEREKVKAKQESEDRRKKWREREIAAGRMKIISFRAQ